MKILFGELVKQYNIKMEYLQDIIDFFESIQEMLQDPKKEIRQIIVFWKKNRIYKALERINDNDKLRTDLMEKEFDKENKLKFFKALHKHEKCELIALKLEAIASKISKFNKIASKRLQREGYPSYYEDLKLLSELILKEIKKNNIIILPKNPLSDLLSQVEKLPLLLNLLLPKNGLFSIVVTDKKNNVVMSWIIGSKNGVINLMASIDKLGIEGFLTNFNWKKAPKREKYFRIVEKKLKQKVKVAIFTTRKCITEFSTRSQKELKDALKFLKEQRKKGEFILPRILPKTTLLLFGTKLLRLFAKDK